MSICKFCGNVVDPGCPCPVCDRIAEIERTEPVKTSTPTKTTHTVKKTDGTVKRTGSTVKRTSGTIKKSSEVKRLNRPIWIYRLFITVGFIYSGIININYLGYLSRFVSFLSFSGILQFVMVVGILFCSFMLYIGLLYTTDSKPSYLYDFRAGIRQVFSLFLPALLTIITLSGAELFIGSFLSTGRLFIRLFVLILLIVNNSETAVYLLICTAYNLWVINATRSLLGRFIPRLNTYIPQISFAMYRNILTNILSILYVILILFMLWVIYDEERSVKK